MQLVAEYPYTGKTLIDLHGAFADVAALRAIGRLSRIAALLIMKRTRLEAASAVPHSATVKPEGQWHHGDLRASLVAWGTYLLDTEGIENMSMRAAARLAGVSQGAPAHHFSDRNGLLAAIAAQGFRELATFKPPKVSHGPMPEADARLRAVILGYVEYARLYPSRFHLMFGPHIRERTRYPELVQASSAAFDLVRGAVVPFLRPAGVGTLSEDELAFAVWSATHGLATLLLEGRSLPSGSGCEPQPRVHQLTDIVVRFCLLALESGCAR
ncbi:MAG: TetR/AcrR family transcriptional regulator [Burkholderiaceae bacterium]